MRDPEIQAEIDRLNQEFANAEPAKRNMLQALVVQAAHETVYLRKLNDIANITGLVKTHPSEPEKQKTLPVSAEIARHLAALTNILDKLMKHLGGAGEDEEDGLDDYE